MTVRLTRMRWWQLPAVMALEEELFESDSWSKRLFLSELAQTGTVALSKKD